MINKYVLACSSDYITNAYQSHLFFVFITIMLTPIITFIRWRMQYRW